MGFFCKKISSLKILQMRHKETLHSDIPLPRHHPPDFVVVCWTKKLGASSCPQRTSVSRNCQHSWRPWVASLCSGTACYALLLPLKWAVSHVATRNHGSLGGIPVSLEFHSWCYYCHECWSRPQAGLPWVPSLCSRFASYVLSLPSNWAVSRVVPRNHGYLEDILVS